jgi:hypothetical protein
MQFYFCSSFLWQLWQNRERPSRAPEKAALALSLDQLSCGGGCGCCISDNGDYFLSNAETRGKRIG